MSQFFHEFHFLRPAWLLALAALPLLWRAVSRSGADAGAWRGVVDAHLLPHLLDAQDAARASRVPRWIAACAWVVACVAPKPWTKHGSINTIGAIPAAANTGAIRPGADDHGRAPRPVSTRPTNASAAIADQMAVATLWTGVRNAALIPSISATAACAATGASNQPVAPRARLLATRSGSTESSQSFVPAVISERSGLVIINLLWGRAASGVDTFIVVGR